MKTKQSTFFGGQRMSMAEAIELTVQSIQAYGQEHDVWSIAYSGGKDSTALTTLIVWLIETGRLARPKKLYVLYGDTRMELPPLATCAAALMQDLRSRDWIDARTVVAPLDQRYFVYMLGRGVPPPNNNTLRWCTAQIKVEPMAAELARVRQEAAAKLLMFIGVRLGESAARDQRIALACSRNGAECGQGWYQRDLPDGLCDKLSPLLHWRTCLVWDWLFGMDVEHGFPTRNVAYAYGADEDDASDEINARTGCVGCPLATKDLAIENLLRQDRWHYLKPLLQLRPIYRRLREPELRLRMPPGERRKDGSLSLNQNRMGPLTLDARLWALEEILGVQAEVNRLAALSGMPAIDLLNTEEETRIRELIGSKTFPNKWSGEEPIAAEPYEAMSPDGHLQPFLFALPTS